MRSERRGKTIFDQDSVRVACAYAEARGKRNVTCDAGRKSKSRLYLWMREIEFAAAAVASRRNRGHRTCLAATDDSSTRQAAITLATGSPGEAAAQLLHRQRRRALPLEVLSWLWVGHEESEQHCLEDQDSDSATQRMAANQTQTAVM